MNLAWRPMEAGDLAAVDAVATLIHTAYPEDAAVFAERLALCPPGCLVLAEGDALAGYVVSHPWNDGAPPKLDRLLGRLPDPATAWYIHDLALLPDARGGGHAGAIVTRLAETARSAGLARMRLVAVSGSVPFWRRHGFHELPSAGRLASYGPEARLMERHLP
jgi:GNAT superfamily N-acetyltransferase